MRRAVALAVLVLLVLSSCGGDDDTVGTGSSSSTSSSSSSTSSSSSSSTVPPGDPSTPTTKPATPTTKPTTPPSTPSGPSAIRISVGGGFVPYGTDFAAVPTLVLADGTAFTPGATTMQYPGPAISPVSTGRLSAQQVQTLLTAAKAAGLAESRDYGQPGITDVGTTTIELVIDGKEHTASIYALGYEDGGAGGLTKAQRDARAKVSAWVTQVSDSVSTAATGSYQPAAYQVLGLPSDPASTYPDPKPNTLDWPVPAKPLAEGPCRDLTGSDATALKGALSKASQITVWRSGGRDWHVVVRATLPGDAPC